MKLEQPEVPLLFSETVVPDIFFAEYLSQMPANSVKVYLYMIFLSKYKKDIALNDMSKKLALPLKDINDAIKRSEEAIVNLKEKASEHLKNAQAAEQSAPAQNIWDHRQPGQLHAGHGFYWGCQSG